MVTSVLWRLPQGKPDKNAAYTGAEPDPRPRIAQPPQKGRACSYYAVNMLRDRIGKNAPKEFESAREIEKLGSLRRKTIERCKESLKLAEQLLTDPNYSKYGLNDPQKAGLFLQRLQDIQGLGTDEQKEEASTVRKLLKDFAAQSKTLREYTQEKYSIVQWNAYFLQKLGKELKTLYAEHVKTGLLEDKQWDQLEETVKANLLEAYFFRSLCQAYGFQTAAWDPSQKIDNLIQEISQRGPLYVKGSYGRSYYEDSPKIVGQFGDCHLWGWAKNAKRKSIEMRVHSIVVVGGSKTQQERVFFVDPLDGSDPDKPEQQKIYAMSYERFSRHNANLYNQVFPDGKIPPSKFKDVGYALFFPKIRAKQISS